MEELSVEQINDIVKNIKMYRVFSTNIIAIGYDEKHKILRIIFKGDSSYLYFNVEKELWDNLYNSDSKGKTLRESIISQKDKYKYLKL